ncbi:hypothetical protein Mal64_25630 [Pseudobythopirellula maris]|uniref:Uncharacterized protein n=1 Tax=Pseudobythopirellula maris TaxID=2527991 RepID=A0A5C5ZQG4_9BACT|nr:hypothetical protein [Pseudobythopirellula maris]TWT89071.1 hypothetical protein Mal64_25630 [Pseudobythopirellula maris]
MLPAYACVPMLAQQTTQLFDGLNQDHRFVLMIVLPVIAAGVVITIVCVFGGVLSTIHRRSQESQLKQDMLDRGMSAEEIATVIEASPPKDWLERWAKKG